jgi:carboxyl-terminal processing protease
MKLSFLRLTRRYLMTGLLVMVIFTAGFAVGNLQFVTLASTENADVLPPANADQEFAAFWETYNLIQKNYVSVPEQNALIDGAIKGMVDALDDQYSGYVEPAFFEYVDDNLSGEIEGIGVTITELEESGQVEVVNVLPGTPAAEAGLREGDIFLEVDGEDVTQLDYLELVTRVRGPAGSIVNLKMLREEAEVEFDIERARIEIPNTETAVYEDSIGYLKLNQFTSNAREDINRALEEINISELDSLIIDVRGNPGGYLHSAIEVTSAFIDEGVIVYEQFSDETEQTFNADGTALDLNIPLVLLIDERSASASEILAGALKDYEAATLIGVTTFGKGTVQTQSELVNGGGIRLTIARWLTPDRQWIHDVGISPDITVEWDEDARAENPDDDPQLEAALEFLQTEQQPAVSN